MLKKRVVLNDRKQGTIALSGETHGAGGPSAQKHYCARSLGGGTNRRCEKGGKLGQGGESEELQQVFEFERLNSQALKINTQELILGVGMCCQHFCSSVSCSSLPYLDTSAVRKISELFFFVVPVVGRGLK